jgi:hypothetical protein
VNINIKYYLSLIVIILLNINLSAQVELDRVYPYDSLYQMLEKAREEKNSQKIADLYFLLAKYEETNFVRSENTLEYYLRAKQYYQRVADTIKINEIDLLIGQRYAKAGLYLEAINIYQRLLDYYSIRKDSFYMAHTNYLLSKVSLLRADNEKALEYINRAILISNLAKDSTSLINYSIEKITCYQKLNELDSALIIAFDAFNLSSQIDNTEFKSKSLYHIGNINNKKYDHERAIKYALISESLADNTAYNENRKNIYYTLSESYKAIDNYSKAYEYLQKYTSLNDSILDREIVESLNNLAVKHHSEENKKKNQLLEIEKKYAEQKNKQQRTALYILMAGVALLSLLLYYFIRFYTQKIRNEKIITDQNEKISDQKIKELEDDIKISSMQSMIEGQEKERERIAKDLHDSLGGMISSIKLQFENAKAKFGLKNKELETTSDLLDTAVEEVRNISRNLQPSALARLGLIAAIKDLINRFKGEAYPDIYFQYYNMPDKIDNLISLSIYRIIQELLNNTLKHAQASEILIQLTKEEDELIIHYEDDGKGFDLEKQNRGLGLENIKSRINYLKASVSFDAKEGEGTSVLIHVPL